LNDLDYAYSKSTMLRSL